MIHVTTKTTVGFSSYLYWRARTFSSYQIFNVHMDFGHPTAVCNLRMWEEFTILWFESLRGLTTKNISYREFPGYISTRCNRLYRALAHIMVNLTALNVHGVLAPAAIPSIATWQSLMYSSMRLCRGWHTIYSNLTEPYVYFNEALEMPELAYHWQFYRTLC